MNVRSSDQAAVKAWLLWCALIGMPALIYIAPYGTYVGPVALGFLPLPPQHFHWGILVTAFTLWLAHDANMATHKVPTLQQRAITAALLVATTCLALWISHPSPATVSAWKQLPVPKGVLLTLGMYVCLLLPGTLCFGMLYPWRALRQCIGILSACALLAAGFIAAGIVSTIWHASLAAPALGLAGWLLRLVDHDATYVETDTFVIGFREFATRVGPQCAALDGVVLFLLLAYACWRYRSHAKPLQALLTAIACAGILFLLNGVRIAGIMIIGSFNRTLGLELFHGVAGMLLVLGMLWVFDRATQRNR